MTSTSKKILVINIELSNRSYNYGWSTTSSSFSSPEEFECNCKSTGFKYVTHSISCNENFSLKFLIPSRESSRYNFLKLFKNGNKDHCSIECKKNENGIKNLYVYFYGDDQRPLLICYNNKAYKAQTKDCYFDKWVEAPGVSNIKKCQCPDTGDDSNCDKLLQALTEVVGFLNEVNLSKYPSGASGNACSNSPSVPGTTTACTTTNGNTCTYEVHKYEGKPVRVKVTCEAVNGKKSNGSCYKKLIHEPVGFNGAKADGAAEGFRLGYVVYNIGSPKPRGIIPYYTGNGPVSNKNRSNYWFKPLVSVSAYFYNQDKNYEDPLLVELQFANGEGKDNGKSCEGKDTVCEYYKLTKTANGKGGTMEWAIDTSAIEEIGSEDNSNMSKYLDGIRYNLKQVLNVEIFRQSAYVLQLSQKLSDTDNGFGPLNGGKTIPVEECTDGTCSKLNTEGYRCFQHKITIIENQNDIGGLKFTVPGQKGQSDIEIELFNGTTDGVDSKCTNGERIDQLTYNRCMGDICVYFYGSDPRPLMLCYDNKAFIPFDKDCYFEKWVKVCDVIKCECTAGGSDGCDDLLSSLVKVSNFLNPVKIDQINGEETSYVIHEFNGQKITINLQEQKATEKFCYNKYIHSHDGIGSDGKGFRLGNIKYDTECIKERTSGKKGECITSVLNEDPPNKYKSAEKVVVFYYQGDKKFERPLLVALCKNGSETCNLYYELQNDGGKGAKRYKKVNDGTSIKVNDTSSGGPLETKLDGIRSKITKHLQIIIDKIPKPILLCYPPWKNKNGQKQDNGKKSPHKLPKPDCQERQPDEDSKILLRPASYKAQLYKPDGKPAQNGTAAFTTTTETTTPTTTVASTAKIQVTLLDCWQLNTYGYRCYEHQITSVTNVDQIGGLRFFLWDNGGGVCGY